MALPGIFDTIHHVDFGRYDEGSGRVLCTRCRQMVSATQWARPCPTTTQPGGAGANTKGGRASECDPVPPAPAPSSVKEE